MSAEQNLELAKKAYGAFSAVDGHSSEQVDIHAVREGKTVQFRCVVNTLQQHVYGAK